MSVTAKMRVTSKKPMEGYDYTEVILQPVYDPDPASPNYSWSKYTPSGEIKMNITNPNAHEQFEVGQMFLIEFTPTT